MLFGLWKAKTNKAQQTVSPEQKGPKRNTRLENAIKNILSLESKEKLLTNTGNLRSGSLSIIAHSNKEGVEIALRNLEKVGAFDHQSKDQVIEQLTDLLKANALKVAYAQKTSTEVDRSLDIFREIGKDLAKAPAKEIVSLAA